MTALHTETSVTSESNTKNPYNTRRKSIYFSPTTHSATFIDSTDATTTLPTSTKHPAQHPEQNPRSPKRVRRPVHVDRSFTPPPSPPSNLLPVAPSAAPALTDNDSLKYDEEDDPVINAIVHVL